jgi:hypothetical protein
MRKQIPRSRLQPNKDKLWQRTQQSPQEHSERRNPASNHWEFHGDITRHGQPKHTKALKKFQDNKNKEYEKTQKQINEIVGALNKHQKETENSINREINEWRLKIDNIKMEVTQDMENLRKKEWNRNTKQNGTNRRQNLRTWKWNGN